MFFSKVINHDNQAIGGVGIVRTTHMAMTLAIIDSTLEEILKLFFRQNHPLRVFAKSFTPIIVIPETSFTLLINHRVSICGIVVVHIKTSAEIIVLHILHPSTDIKFTIIPIGIWVFLEIDAVHIQTIVEHILIMGIPNHLGIADAIVKSCHGLELLVGELPVMIVPLEVARSYVNLLGTGD